MDSRVLARVSEKLEPSDMALDSHNRILNRMVEMDLDEVAIDLITLGNRLRRHKELELIGGFAYLSSLTEGIPFNAELADHITEIRDKALLRRLMLVSSNAIARAQDQFEEAAAIVSDVEQAIVSIAEKGIAKPLETFGVYIEHRYSSIDAIFQTSAKEQGTPTGFRELDELTCGLQRKDLIIVAARPSMGKTAIGLGLALHAAVLLGRVTALFSLEMTKEAMLQRAIAAQGSVALHDIRKGRWTTTTKRYAMEALDQLTAAPLYIDDEPGMSVQRLKAKALRLKNQAGRLDLVVIDQLNHIAITENKRNRTDEIGTVTRGLKVMAKILDCPLVLLHQVNRENEKRDDRKPRLSDLRDSGNVEQDADVVIFPHRPSYYAKDPEERAKRDAVLIVAKQRNGATGEAACEWIADHVIYRDVPDEAKLPF